MSVERGGYMQDGPVAMGTFRNLSSPTRPYFSVRFKLLGHIGAKVPAEYVGNTMTWAELGSVGIPWGDSETVIYDSLQPGWSYVFNPGKKTFTVTDAANVVTVHSGIKSLSDLGIVWEILESSQFKIVFDASFEANAFLIAWKYIHGRVPPGEEDPGGDPNNPLFRDKRADMMQYSWALVDQYLNTGTVDSRIGRFVLGKDGDVVEDATTATISGTDLSRTILLANTVDLSAFGDYPTNYFPAPDQHIAAQDTRTKTGQIIDRGTLLMIASFASIMNMSKPVFEPWMLWKMWEWAGKGSVVVTRERCFDLSPWWG